MDSSAVLADLHGEPGAETVRSAISNSYISAVNFAEVITKLIEIGVDANEATLMAERMGYEVVDVDQARATAAGVLHMRTRGRGISLGDRFCLALAQETGLPVLTADRSWKDLDLGIEITLIG